ncbi:MAG: NAD-dependent epimerase/dehydratase family protein, partial [Verrucomicrobiales bacterium]|nr:NAD-dependent epimerase/dehydratase family protein [Verrucomicrobiales bacterium]
IEDRTGDVISPYAATKAMDELYAGVFAKCYPGFEAIGLRYFNVFGPRQDPNGPYAAVIPLWIQAMLDGNTVYINGDGETSRDFTYVDDIARGTILAARPMGSEGVAGHEVINLGGGKTPISLLDFIGKIEDRLGRKAEIVWQPMSASEMQDTAADISKAKQVLDWEPEVDLDAGLDATVAWYLENVAWAGGVRL